MNWNLPRMTLPTPPTIGVGATIPMLAMARTIVVATAKLPDELKAIDSWRVETAAMPTPDKRSAGTATTSASYAAHVGEDSGALLLRPPSLAVAALLFRKDGIGCIDFGHRAGHRFDEGMHSGAGRVRLLREHALLDCTRLFGARTPTKADVRNPTTTRSL